MKNTKSFHSNLFALLILSLLIDCKSVAQMKEKFKLNDTVQLSGNISENTYLSRSDNSDKEYSNNAYTLQLEKNIEVIDNKDLTKIFKGISHVEIENDYKYVIYKYVGKKAKIKGVLKTFTESPGYHRQYSTPIKIDIIKIEIEGNDCKGGKADASKEIKAKKYSLYIIGPKRYDSEFVKYFTKYLLDKYNLKLVIYGCEIDEYIDCYVKEMSKGLEKQYGVNYLDKFEKEAKNLYKRYK